MISKIAPRLSDRHPFFWITLLLGTVVFGLYIAAAVMIFQFGTMKKDWGWSSVYRDGKPYVAEVLKGGPAEGKLLAGDQIVAINEDSRVGNGKSPILPLKLRTIAPNSSYTISLARGPSNQTVSLFLPLRKDYGVLIYILPGLIVGLSVYVLALLTGFLRPEQRVTQFCSLAYFCIATFILRYTLGSIIGFLPSSFYRILVPLSSSITPLSIPLLYGFRYLFPANTKKRRSWLITGYTLSVIGFIEFVWILYRNSPLILWDEQGAIDAFSRFNYAQLNSVANTNDIYMLIGIIACCAVMVRNYLSLKDADQKRRIKWAIYGDIVGYAPPLLYILANVILENTGYSYITKTRDFDLAGYIIILSLVICPVTLGYSIIKHKVLDINVVIRHGLQYLLAKNFLRAILTLQAATVVYIVVRNPNMTIGEILSPGSVHIYLISTTLLGLIYRTRLSDWIDRKFFRQVYNREKILLELIDEIKRLDSVMEISRLVGRRVDEALRLECIYIYYRAAETGNFLLGHSSNDLLNNQITVDAYLLDVLEDEERAQDLSFFGQLPRDEKEWLDRLGIDLIVPMRGTDHHLTGLLLLGKKRSEEPFSPSDRELIEAIAGQIAVVHENILLKESVNKERKIKREVLARFEDRNINLVKECPSCGSCFDSAVEFCSTDHSELKFSLPVERIIGKRYRLDRHIGKGAMGAVYESTDLRLNRKVAIKIMLGSMFGNQEALRRFEREARSSARLNHPNIIAVHDYGRLSNEGAYLVMELLDGVSLRSKLQGAPTLEAQSVADLFDQLLEGVKAAHQAGVIHRDLKPENVFIRQQKEGRALVKILDFGLSKFKQADTQDSGSLTTPGTIMGTMGYMALEQLCGDAVDERADIFAVGVMAAEALTGTRPFFGKTISETMMAILRGSFHLDGDSEQARRLDAVLQRCLAKDREDRFASVADMQKELIPAIREFLPATLPPKHPLQEDQQDTDDQEATTRAFSRPTAEQPEQVPLTDESIDAERWQRIKRIFHSVLELETSQRSRFLDQACADDPALKEEVEALIASHEEAKKESLFNQPAGAIFADLLKLEGSKNHKDTKNTKKE